MYAYVYVYVSVLLLLNLGVLVIVLVALIMHSVVVLLVFVVPVFVAAEMREQPVRVVMTRSGKLPRNARFFTDRFAKNSFVYRKMSLGEVLAELGQKQVTSVLIEGGGNLLGHALDERLIDK